MADSAPAVLGAASLPASDAISRAAAFTREPFLSEGEDPAVVLASGTPRRRALDAALAELAAGERSPSVQWRRDWSLLLGLDRVLSQEEPHLVDGTVLNAHQVDALSGTLTALLADVETGGGAERPPADNTTPAEASSGIPGEPELPEELREDGADADADGDDDEPQDWTDEANGAGADQVADAPEDPNAGKRFWFEHATGAGKTVAALGFVESSQTGGVLILTHRRNLVDQFHGELRDRGYAKRITGPLLRGQDSAAGPVTVETYQWFVRNAGNISDAYTIVICDEAHTALGEKTSAAIRAWAGPIFIGMTATGALIARHVTDLFPTQTSRFDLAQAARRGVISPLRSVRIPPGPGVRTIAKVPLRRGEVDVEFDQEMLAELLDQQPFNLAIADLYKTRFDSLPGVVYTAGVRHAHNVAQAFIDLGLKARAVSGETPKRQLAQILAGYERGDIDVLVNAQLLAEGWNSPRATVCLHLAPTASKRIYQQRVGRVTRRHPGKEAGIVVDFVHPATKHDDPVVTLHSLLDRDVYRGGAIVVGPVRRGRGRRLRVERRVVPVTADPNRRIEVFERELWRIAVEHLDWGEQVQWAALAGARVSLTGWRRARAMLHFDQGGELKRTFLVTAVQRNKNPQLRLRALQEIAQIRDGDAFDAAIEMIGGWSREDKREGVKVVLQTLAEKKIGRRDQANNWIWRCAEYTRDVHEEYAAQRWPETKRLLGLLVNSAAGAHARNARRLVHASRDQDRRLQAALLAAAVPHTAEAGEVINGARARLARKPPSLARELLRNFPKPKAKKARRRRRGKGADSGEAAVTMEGQELVTATTAQAGADDGAGTEAGADQTPSKSSRRRRSRRRNRAAVEGQMVGQATAEDGRSVSAGEQPGGDDAEATPKPSRRSRRGPRRTRDADPGEDTGIGTVDGATAQPAATEPGAAGVAAQPATTDSSADDGSAQPATTDSSADDGSAQPAEGEPSADDQTASAKPRARRSARSRKTAAAEPEATATAAAAETPSAGDDASQGTAEAASTTDKAPRRAARRRKDDGDSPAEPAATKPRRSRKRPAATGAEGEAATAAETAPEPDARDATAAETAPAPDAPEAAPKRRRPAAKPRKTAAEAESERRAREEASADVVAVAVAAKRSRTPRRRAATSADAAEEVQRAAESAASDADGRADEAA